MQWNDRQRLTLNAAARRPVQLANEARGNPGVMPSRRDA